MALATFAEVILAIAWIGRAWQINVEPGWPVDERPTATYIETAWPRKRPRRDTNRRRQRSRAVLRRDPEQDLEPLEPLPDDERFGRSRLR
jgi:hypothetical protein